MKLSKNKKLELDFDNYQLAFRHYTDQELKEVERLFRLMNNKYLVKIGAGLALLAVKLHIPFAKKIIQKTIFKHFVGGTTLLDCQSTIDKLYDNNVLTILDYGVEAVQAEEGFENTCRELLKALDFAAANDSSPAIVCKLTSICSKELLEKDSEEHEMTLQEKRDLKNFSERLDMLCKKASERNTALFIDAEESWIQKSIDRHSMKMMRRYNREKVVVFKTYQMYRHDKLEELKEDFSKLREKDIYLGAKIVRGAYMDKERKRAEEQGVPCLINPDKKTTDEQFDDAVVFCVENYEYIGSVCASHNLESNYLQAEKIHEMGITKSHSHLNFCQLYGMGDYLSYNIANEGYNVAKYVPYGKVSDVIAYLIRRAKENTSMTGDMSRELSIIRSEIQRRGI